MKKKLFVITSLLLMSVLTWAQAPSDDIFQKYAKKEGVELSAMSGFMLKPFVDGLTSSLNESEKEKITEYLKNVTSITLVQTVNQNSQLVSELMTEANKLAQNGKYTQLLAQKNNDLSFKLISLKNKDNITTELLGFGSIGNEAAIVSVQGKFTDAMIKELLAKAIQQFNK